MKIKAKTKDRLLSVLLGVLLLAFWQIAAELEWVRPLYSGKPTEIFLSLVDLLRGGEIWVHLAYSFRSFIFGLGLALFFGIGGGIAIGSSDRAFRILSPYIYMLQVIPKIVLLPLMIIWFGIGLQSKVILIFIMALIPVIVTTTNSIRNVDTKLIKMGQSFGASRTFIVSKISFFSALPEILSGVKLGIGRATSGMIISEFFGVNKGLGSLISYYGASYKTSRLFAVIVIILFWNLVMLKYVDYISSKIKK